MDTGRYKVGKLLGETDSGDLYEYVLPDKTVGILKIAHEEAKNGPLDREAFILQQLREEAERLEKEYDKTKPKKDEFLGYALFFPNLVESVITED